MIIPLIITSIILGIPTVLLIVMNTRDIREHRALARELMAIQQMFDGLPHDIAPGDPALRVVTDRMTAYENRFRAWQRSPFVRIRK